MPAETIAQASATSGAPDEDDYQAFCQTLSASERGRAFLAEYTRRNRNADIEQLLAAIEQLQSVMVQPTPHRTDMVKGQLRELLDEIGSAQCELDELLLATKTEALADLIARVESRISRILASRRRCAGGSGDAIRIRGGRRAARRACADSSRGRAGTRATRIANSIAKRLQPAGHCARAQRDRIG